jgi:hypothetical protein
MQPMPLTVQWFSMGISKEDWREQARAHKTPKAVFSPCPSSSAILNMVSMWEI